MTKTALEVAARYRRKYWREADPTIFEKYNVSGFANPDFPIITNDEYIQIKKWGLIPRFIKTNQEAKKVRNMTLNARAETIFKLPSFRNNITSHRCIVPSTGFFEPHVNPDKTRTPYFVRLKNEEIFSLAGIYDSWTDKETGEELHTFSIITTEANPLLAEIHNEKKRMPVILSNGNEERWLQPDLSKEELQELLVPFDELKMEAWAVNPDFRKKNPHDKTIIDKT